MPSVAPTGREHTLLREVRVSGIGLRSGLPAAAHLRPATAGSGRTFVVEGTRIPATVHNVVDTRLATVLGAGAGRISLVEHLCAALYALEIDNVEIEVEGGEIPALDGSSQPWVSELASAGRLAQERPRLPWVVTEPVEVRLGASWARLEPAAQLEIDVTVCFEHPAIGRQRYASVVNAATFSAELAWARTFGFLADADALRAMGIAQGASLDNTLVYDQEGPMNGLRSPDEVVRHKALDVVGDLALLGAPLHARLTAERPGHALHLALLRALLGLPAQR